MTDGAGVRSEETEARELLIKVNAGAPLVERKDHLRPKAPPVVFVQIPVAVEAIQQAYLLGYEAGRSLPAALAPGDAVERERDRYKAALERIADPHWESCMAIARAALAARREKE